MFYIWNVCEISKNMYNLLAQANDVLIFLFLCYYHFKHYIHFLYLSVLHYRPNLVKLNKACITILVITYYILLAVQNLHKVSIGILFLTLDKLEKVYF